MDILPFIDFKTLLAFLVTFLGCFLYLGRQKNLPPGPWGLPFFGNLLWMMRRGFMSESPGRMFLRESKPYGDLMYLKLGKQGLLVIFGYDAVQEFYVKNAEHFSNRPHWMNPTLQEILKDGRGLIWQSGEDWKKMRKFVLHSLREFGVGKTSLEDKIFAEIEAASIVLKKTAGEPTDVRRLANLMIANIIYGIVFGKRHDYDDEAFLSIMSKIEAIFQRGGALDFNNRMPNFMFKLFGRDKSKESEKRLGLVQNIRSHISQEVEEHETSFDDDNIRDFIDLYIQNKKAGEDKHLFTEGNVFRMIMDLFLAGSDTTSNTIIWSMLYMIEYPDVQTRCQQEIYETYGDQDIRWCHKNTLPYVEATLMEIQRLANVAEMSLPHTNEHEVTMRGYTIPAHTIVNANLLSCNKDPRHWQDPDTFNPDRFLHDGKLKKNPALVPFSAGPRICVGESLAKMEMFLVFTNFLQRFTFKRVNPDVANSFERVKMQITSTPVAFKTRVVSRY